MRTFKAEVARCGRDPEQVKITQLVNTVAAATKAEAEDKWAEIDKLPLEIDALSLLSEALNFDFARKGMDEAFSDAEIAGNVRPAGHPRPGRARSGKKQSDSARLHRDQRPRPGAQPDRRRPEGGRRPARAWFVERACDGFVLSATHVPGAYEDFVRFVVPELQRRGLFRKEFAGLTLRENLGLPVPALGAWRGAKTPPTTAKQT